MLGHRVLQRLSTDHVAVGTVHRSAGDPPYDRIPLFRDTTIIGGVEADDMSTVVGAIEAARPDVVVNAIGVIKQRHADPVAAIAVNALFPHRLAARCAADGIRLIHISTDCVFSGSRGGYTEDDVPDATDLYGRTKALGEIADSDHVLTLRTSLVGRELTSFQSLLEWFLAQRGEVRGFRRAYFSGVSTLWMAECIATLIHEHRSLHGRYQVAGPRISKYDLLHLFATAFRRRVTIVPDDEFVIDRSLVGDRFVAATGLQAPSWEAMVDDLAADPTPYEEWR